MSPHIFSRLLDERVQSNECAVGAALPPLSLSVKTHSLSASPPDGLPPFNAGVAAHGDRGRRWEGTESQRIDLRTAVGPQRETST